MVLKYFTSSFAVTAAGLIAGYMIGGGWSAVFTTAILAILETSLSFDNAVVNATVLKDMDIKWRKRFITWGMLIAVFGMRMVFPLVIVAVIAGVGIIDAFRLAVFNPVKYAEALTSAHVSVAAFGGAFLMMVFLRYFIDKKKTIHWIGALEIPLTKLGKIEAVQMAIVLIVMYFVSRQIKGAEQVAFWVSGAMGLVTYVIADGIGAIIGAGETQHNATVAVAKSGFASFMYLEILDASFSFDGVIGAFALTDNFFIIAIGLGIGAMFVRSLTIMMVERGTLAQFKYLEHSAFWAIGALAVIMFLGAFMHISEVATGTLSAVFIAAGVIHSMIEKNKPAAAE
ncbi:MAG: DUF475 domain-containing protein [Lentisphaerota bacterium]